MPIQTNGNIRILGNLDRFVDLDVVLQIQVPGITGNLITRAVSVVYQLLGVRIIAQRTENALVCVLSVQSVPTQTVCLCG